MSDKFKKYSDTMLEILISENQESIKKFERLIDNYQREIDDANKELNNRLKERINISIKKIKDSGESSFG